MAKRRRKSAKEKRCIKKVKADVAAGRSKVNPFAVCRASIAGTTKRKSKKGKKK